MRPRAHGAWPPPGKGTGTEVTACQAVLHGAFSSLIAFASILKPHKFGLAHRHLHLARLGWGTRRLLATGTPADPPSSRGKLPKEPQSP